MVALNALFGMVFSQAILAAPLEHAPSPSLTPRAFPSTQGLFMPVPGAIPIAPGPTPPAIFTSPQPTAAPTPQLAPITAYTDTELAAVGLGADRTEIDVATDTLIATGHVVLNRGAVHIEAEALRYERKTGKGSLAGPITVTGNGFVINAERATFNLRESSADLYAFTGRWQKRAKLEGTRLHISEKLIELEASMVTPCMAKEPDVWIKARQFRFYPNASVFNMSATGVSLRALGQDILTLPELTHTLKDSEQAHISDWIFPALSFDAYRGLLTSTNFDFTLGPGSRGSIPILFSSGRGLSVSIEHALGIGPGEVVNAARYETPWTTGQGGFRLQNGYQWQTKDGSRFEGSLDYRANINDQPVHRLPELAWFSPSYGVAGVLNFQSELRGAYLWEANSNVQATRFRWVVPFSTPVWVPIPSFQTWVNGAPFANHYVFTHFAGGQVAWNARENLLSGLALTQMVETIYTNGESPFIHDRLTSADRVRVGIERDWHPRFSTSLGVAASRLNHLGPMLIEDVALSGLYRWNCFAVQLTLRPLIWGVDTRFQALEF